ncbi:MAG: HEAT repeat domain-containing protein [Minicystis sp.]
MNASSTRKYLAFVTVSGALASATWMGLHHEAATAAAAPASTAAPTAAATPARAPALPARRWTVGESFVYEVVAGRAVSTGEKGQGFDATLTATLAITVAGHDDKGVQLRAELRAPRFDAGAAPGTVTPESLTRPFYVTALPSGELGPFSFAKGTPAEVVGLLKGLMASLQVVAPGAPLAAWSTTERDATGEYEARYTRTNAGVHKEKRAYLRANGAAGLRALPGKYAVTSSIDFTVDDAGWPRTLAEEESLDLEVAAIHVVSKSRTRAKLVAVEVAANVAPPDPASLESDVESEAAGFARARVNAERGLVAGRGFKDIAAAFRAPEVQKRNDAMVAMGALFRLDPGATVDAREALLHGQLDGESAARTAAALGSAGTPEAQGALRAIMASPDADSTRMMQAAVALGQSEHQAPENEAALEKAMTSEAHDVAGTATLALGSTIRTRNAENLGDTQGALQTLLDALARATTVDGKRVALLALGNTGDTRALPAIEPYLASPDVDLRIAAVTALRRMPGEQAEKDLQAALADGSYLVRRAAVKAVESLHGVDLGPALAQMIHTEPEVSVRITILSVLYPVTDQVPAAFDAIRWAAENDPSNKVRDAARSFLALEG